MFSLKFQEVEDSLKFQIWNFLFAPVLWLETSKFSPCSSYKLSYVREDSTLRYEWCRHYYCCGGWSSEVTPWFPKVFLLPNTLFQVATGNNLYNHNPPKNHWFTISHLIWWLFYLRSSTWGFLSWDYLWSQEVYWLIQTGYENATVNI